MLETVASPPNANGWTWWSSSKARSAQRRPGLATNAHCPRSRTHTARFTDAGMCRDPGLADLAGRGMDVAAVFSFAICATRRASARSMIAPGSPSGISRRRRSWARRRSAWAPSPQWCTSGGSDRATEAPGPTGQLSPGEPTRPWRDGQGCHWLGRPQRGPGRGADVLPQPWLSKALPERAAAVPVSSPAASPPVSR